VCVGKVKTFTTCGGDDVNAVVSGYLRDLAYAQSTKPRMFGYKRAAAAIFHLERSLVDLVREHGGELPRIPGIGPSSARIIREVLEGGGSAIVERAIDASGRRADIERRRTLRVHFLSRAAVIRILHDPALGGPSLHDYRADLQMHSEWSDGTTTIDQIVDACQARGYTHAAVTDHSYGLTIAGGMSMEEAAAQRRAIDAANNTRGGAFRLLQGMEANITIDGDLDLDHAEAAIFDLVLAAPHSRLRKTNDQTARMLRALEHPAVRILAHPRGRITGSRAGVVADWPAVFARPAQLGIALEIDGDPARQDLDYELAAEAGRAGCLFALDSDAHTTGQLAYAETAIAHARLAGITPDRIVNCWPLDRLLAWIADPASELL
jgi:putative hydrolase